VGGSPTLDPQETITEANNGIVAVMSVDFVRNIDFMEGPLMVWLDLQRSSLPRSVAGQQQFFEGKGVDDENVTMIVSSAELYTPVNRTSQCEAIDRFIC